MIDDLPEDDTRPMPTRFKLGCPYCGLVGIGSQHEEVCPENPARKMAHAELIAMCEEHQRQLAERDAEIEKLQTRIRLLECNYSSVCDEHGLVSIAVVRKIVEIEKLREWQRDAATLLVLTLGSIERPSNADLKEHRKVLTRLISEMPIELLSEVEANG